MLRLGVEEDETQQLVVEPVVNWNAQSGREYELLKALIENGPAELKKVFCPHPGCTVRGARFQLHQLWCAYQPMRHISAGMWKATGGLRLRDYENDEVFNQSFLGMGLTFLIVDNRKCGQLMKRIRCVGDPDLHYTYTIKFRLDPFTRYSIKGQTRENNSRGHLLNIPCGLSLLKLVPYSIRVYLKN